MNSLTAAKEVQNSIAKLTEIREAGFKLYNAEKEEMKKMVAKNSGFLSSPDPRKKRALSMLQQISDTIWVRFVYLTHSTFPFSVYLSSSPAASPTSFSSVYLSYINVLSALSIVYAIQLELRQTLLDSAQCLAILGEKARIRDRLHWQSELLRKCEELSADLRVRLGSKKNLLTDIELVILDSKRVNNPMPVTIEAAICAFEERLSLLPAGEVDPIVEKFPQLRDLRFSLFSFQALYYDESMLLLYLADTIGAVVLASRLGIFGGAFIQAADDSAEALTAAMQTARSNAWAIIKRDHGVDFMQTLKAPKVDKAGAAGQHKQSVVSSPSNRSSISAANAASAYSVYTNFSPSSVAHAPITPASAPSQLGISVNSSLDPVLDEASLLIAMGFVLVKVNTVPPKKDEVKEAPKEGESSATPPPPAPPAEEHDEVFLFGKAREASGHIERLLWNPASATDRAVETEATKGLSFRSILAISHQNLNEKNTRIVLQFVSRSSIDMNDEKSAANTTAPPNSLVLEAPSVEVKDRFLSAISLLLNAVGITSLRSDAPLPAFRPTPAPASPNRSSFIYGQGGAPSGAVALPGMQPAIAHQGAPPNSAPGFGFALPKLSTENSAMGMYSPASPKSTPAQSSSDLLASIIAGAGATPTTNTRPLYGMKTTVTLTNPAASGGGALAAAAPAPLSTVTPQAAPSHLSQKQTGAQQIQTVENWTENYTKDGRLFYYNPATGESRWEKPLVGKGKVTHNLNVKTCAYAGCNQPRFSRNYCSKHAQNSISLE